MKKLIYGVGINDADYSIQKNAIVNGKLKEIWRCPFYSKWKSMMQRCYSDKYLISRPTYIGCSVASEWHHFMTFRAWMVEQDWEGKELDKDLIFAGNRIYSPLNCCFISQKVNSFLTECTASRGEWPIGVDFHKKSGKFQARCWSVETGKRKYLGLYESPEQAHKACSILKLNKLKF